MLQEAIPNTFKSCKLVTPELKNGKDEDASFILESCSYCATPPTNITSPLVRFRFGNTAIQTVAFLRCI